jgi:hypothetical protein
MSDKRLRAQGMQGRHDVSHLEGAAAASYNENRAFSPQKATATGKNLSLFQPLARQIRYLADQWQINGIFSPINEFCAR